MIRLIAAIIFIVSILEASPAVFAEANTKEAFVYNSGGKRDPFIPLITGKTKVAAGLEDVRSVDDIALEGIVWDPHGGSVAILNGVILREGQKKGSVRIKKIEKKGVTLYINETECNIELIEKGDRAREEY